MKINTALILCAGFGKRLNPITLDQPKALLKLNNVTLLENTINLIKELDIKKIILNTFHLKYQIKTYLNENKFDKNFFKNDFEILSVLRNLKIIGIFARLAIRDKKRKYLKLIPYAWNLIEFRLKNNFIFNDLKNFLDINFSKKIRIKK